MNSLISGDYQTAIAKLDTVIGDCCTAVANARKANHPMMVAMTTARATNMLRELITDEMMRDIMALQGSHLGFITDKDADGGYKVGVIREVMIEAALKGFRMVGNETNIIAGRHYGTKLGYRRKVLEIEGFSDLVLEPGVPEQHGTNALVPLIATWKLDGKPLSIRRLKTPEIDRRIPVRVNAKMGADAIVGKAERKILKEIYELCCGYTIADSEDSPAAPEVIDAVEISEPPPSTGINASIQRYRDRIAEATERGQLTGIVERLDLEIALPVQAREDLRKSAREKFKSLPE
ncbi:hypothetical protein [Roseimaritima ulvae]|uniref:Uncharacterized protein n=1 Tax=Roseimaritima ulvae TaxID=980254 RepID=A0A5B9QST0_9BACT|nr:hypothetical protein [Roseimaritima ulvae]QEG40455.1 hypothetical protein UC8_24670 [Roseimaritima ulvae]